MEFAIAYVAAVVLGGIAGSFINVVVYRLPSVAAAGIRPNATKGLSFLAWPLSFCPHCGAGIKPWNNVPVVSYLLLGGRSPCCGKRISPRYIALELLGIAATVLCVARFGPGIQFLWACLFCWFLIAICWIDAQRYILPDVLVLPMLWLGLLANLNGTFVPLQESVLAAASGYLLLYALSEASRGVTGRRMIGTGDPKLLAALGAWMGWLMLLALFVAALTTSVAGLVAQLLRGRDKELRLDSALAFGPHLGAAGFFVLVAGGWLLALYLP